VELYKLENGNALIRC